MEEYQSRVPKEFKNGREGLEEGSASRNRESVGGMESRGEMANDIGFVCRSARSRLCAHKSNGAGTKWAVDASQHAKTEKESGESGPQLPGLNEARRGYI